MKVIFGEPAFRQHGPRNFEVVKDFHCTIELGSRLHARIVVPKGFITDLASIPRIFWPILPPFGDYTAAAIVHDFLYTQPHPIASREIADRVLYCGAIAHGFPTWKAWVMWLAVRIGAAGHWD